MGSVKLLLFVALGFVIARLFSLEGLEHASWYSTAVTTLLAIGLYASTHGIDVDEAKKHFKLLLSAVTIGVILKSVIIGGTMFALTRDPIFMLLGIVMAQIDPLCQGPLFSNKSHS